MDVNIEKNLSSGTLVDLAGNPSINELEYAKSSNSEVLTLNPGLYENLLILGYHMPAILKAYLKATEMQ